MFQILKKDKTDSDFYSLLGPIFGSRKFAKEVGIHCYADTGKTFFVALAGDDVIGVLSVKKNIISDCYVYEPYRRLGILSDLLRNALEDGKHYKANCTEMSKGAFKKLGFFETSKTKNFTMMERK